jgi:hypothetical protein
MTNSLTSASPTGVGRLALLLAAALTAFTAVAVFAASPRPPVEAPASTAATGATALPAPARQEDLSDPDQVCRTFAAALLTVDATDGSPHDAYRRAAGYATAELAAAMTAGLGRWPANEQHTVQSMVEVVDYVGDHLRHDTAGVAYRAVLATATDHENVRQRHIIYCTLRRTGAACLVAGYERELLP